jgi:hypothetical protein
VSAAGHLFARGEAEGFALGAGQRAGDSGMDVYGLLLTRHGSRR